MLIHCFIIIIHFLPYSYHFFPLLNVLEESLSLLFLSSQYFNFLIHHHTIIIGLGDVVLHIDRSDIIDLIHVRLCEDDLESGVSGCVLPYEQVVRRLLTHDLAFKWVVEGRILSTNYFNIGCLSVPS